MVVHLLTASGAVLGLWGIAAAADGRIRDAFLAMLAATAIDAIDGWLARRFDVRRRVPHIDGARLDDIVDYLTFVVLPAFVLLEVDLAPPGWAWILAVAMLLSSAFGFARTDAKTEQAFTGFPSYWNVVVFYLAAGGLPPAANAVVVLVLALLVFVPLGYVYPTKTVELRRTTLTLAAAWGAALLWLTLRYPDVPRGWLAATLAFPAYYFILSLTLHARRIVRSHSLTSAGRTAPRPPGR
jgi:phosphatidylcholine synthase